MPTHPNTQFVRVTDLPVAGGVPDTTTAYVLGTDDVTHTHYIGIEGTQDFRQLLIDADAVPRGEHTHHPRPFRLRGRRARRG